MNFPTDFVEAAVVLEPNTGTRADEAIKLLAERGLRVLVGLSRQDRAEVLRLALQPHIREYCPKDCTDQRFASDESAKHWLAGGRAMFLLAKQTPGNRHEIVGYGWVGTKATPEVPGGETTFAVRLGEAALGQKLSVPFSQAIIWSAMALYGAQNVWLETWSSNSGAAHSYQKLGFKLVSQKNDNRLRPDGSSVADSRLFMKLD